MNTNRKAASPCLLYLSINETNKKRCRLTNGARRWIYRDRKFTSRRRQYSTLSSVYLSIRLQFDFLSRRIVLFRRLDLAGPFRIEPSRSRGAVQANASFALSYVLSDLFDSIFSPSPLTALWWSSESGRTD